MTFSVDQGDLKFFYEASYAGDLGPADIKIEGKDLIRDPGFETGVLESFFTNARADEGDVLPPTAPFRDGYFGNVLVGFNIGSKAWLLERSKLDNSTLRLLEQYYMDSVAWMKADGIISAVKVVARRSPARKDQADFQAEFRRKAQDVVFFNFFVNWEYQTIGGRI